MDRDANTVSDGGSGAESPNPHVFCLQGKTLAEALSETRTAKERLRLLPQFASLCDAVGAAHSRGVIHRALHPDVVLLSDYGETVISDWSLSKVRGRADHPGNRFGEAAAKPALRPYLAPEVITGGSDEADARSDVYALGAILHELLTGRPPRSDAGSPEPADAVDPDIPRELVQVCRRAMFREASARYANASQLADNVRQAEIQPIPAAADPPAAGVDPLFKTLLGAAVLCLVVLAAAFGFVYHGLSADRNEAIKIRDQEIEMRRDAEEARDKLAAELKDADVIRTRIETDRDSFEDALNQSKVELEQVRGEVKSVKEQLITAQGAAKVAETIAVQMAADRPAEPEGAPEKAVQAAPQPEPASGKPAEGVVEPFSTPLPDLNLTPEEPAPAEPSSAEPAAAEPAAAEPAAAEPAATTPVSRPGGIEKHDFAKAMPDLMASIVTVENAESNAAIKITDATPPAVKAMGFRDGDIITRINRNPIKTVDDAKRALVNVQKDTGFSIRVIRQNGRTGWMRVNFTKPTPPAPPAPAPAQPEEQQPAAAPTPELPQADAATPQDPAQPEQAGS